ncbi:MAG: DUF1552 domain-containing protein [Vicinamibacterales bacterium]
MRQPLARRAFLRGIGKGAGVAIALPLLEAMIPGSLIGSAEAAARAARVAPRNRLVLLYYPNGIHTPNWYPTIPGVATVAPTRNPGAPPNPSAPVIDAQPDAATTTTIAPYVNAEYPLSPALQPLARHRQDFLLLGGLNVPLAKLDQAGDHAKALSCYLTGVHIKKTATDDIQSGISMDQVIANAIGDQTRFPSLELGLDYGRMEGGCDPGYACIYSNNVSWKNETTPAIKEVNPRIVFDRLFGHARQSDHQGESRDMQETYNRSILDYTRDSLSRITKSLGVNDRLRVDEYLTAIRELERRLDAPPSDIELPPDVTRPTRVPDTFKEHFELMADLQILAIRQDVTRVSTFMLGVEQSRRTYNEIGIPEEHHGLTHHAGNEEKIAKVCKIDAYCAEQFAYFLDKMKVVKEGEQTLLDNSMVLLGNGNGDAARHDHYNCMTLLAGRGGGTLSPGRYIKYDNVVMSNLWLSLMDRMGVEVERHGDSTGRLPLLKV